MSAFNKSLYAFALLFPAWVSAQSLTLSCDGQGTVLANQTTTVNQFDAKHKDNKTALALTQVHKPFKGNGMVEIASGMGRMRIPDPMIPPLSSGDSKGWYPIEKLVESDREFTGVVRINFMNQPKLRIDRMTGKLSMSGGLSEFSADCVPAETKKPKF